MANNIRRIYRRVWLRYPAWYCDYLEIRAKLEKKYQQ